MKSQQEKQETKFDIALSRGCKELKTFAKNIKQTTPLAPKWLPTDQFLRSTRCGPNEGMSHAHYPEYMSQLNLPGSAQGSYSKK